MLALLSFSHHHDLKLAADSLDTYIVLVRLKYLSNNNSKIYSHYTLCKGKLLQLRLELTHNV